MLRASCSPYIDVMPCDDAFLATVAHFVVVVTLSQRLLEGTPDMPPHELDSMCSESQAAVIGGMSYNKLAEKLLDFRSISGEEPPRSSERDVQAVQGASAGDSSGLAGSSDSRDQTRQRPLTREGPVKEQAGSEARSGDAAAAPPGSVESCPPTMRRGSETERREGTRVAEGNPALADESGTSEDRESLVPHGPGAGAGSTKVKALPLVSEPPASVCHIPYPRSEKASPA